MATLATLSVKLEADTAAFQAQMAAAQRALDRLSKVRDVKVNIDADVAGAVAKVGLFKQLLDRVDKRVNVQIDADTSGFVSGMAQADVMQRRVEKRSKGLFGGLKSIVAGAADAMFVFSRRTKAAAVALGIMGAAMGILSLAVGAFGAIAALSFGIAGAAMLVLGAGVVALAGMFLKENKRVAASWTALGKHVSKSMTSALAPLVPVAIQAANELRGAFDAVLPAIRTAFATIAPVAAEGVRALGESIRVLGQSLLPIVNSTAPAFAAFFRELPGLVRSGGVALEMLAAAIGQTGAAMAGEAMPALGNFIVSMGKLGAALINVGGRAFPLVFNSLAKLGVQLAAMLHQIEPAIAPATKAIFDLAGAIVIAFGNSTPHVIAFSEAVSRNVDFVRVGIERLIEGFSNFGVAFLDAVSPVTPELGTIAIAITDVAVAFLNALAPALKTVLPALAEFATALAPELVRVLKELEPDIQAVADKFANFLRELIPLLPNIGDFAEKVTDAGFSLGGLITTIGLAIGFVNKINPNLLAFASIVRSATAPVRALANTTKTFLVVALAALAFGIAKVVDEVDELTRTLGEVAPQLETITPLLITLGVFALIAAIGFGLLLAALTKNAPASALVITSFALLAGAMAIVVNQLTKFVKELGIAAPEIQKISPLILTVLLAFLLLAAALGALILALTPVAPAAAVVILSIAALAFALALVIGAAALFVASLALLVFALTNAAQHADDFGRLFNEIVAFIREGGLAIKDALVSVSEGVIEFATALSQLAAVAVGNLAQLAVSLVLLAAGTQLFKLALSGLAPDVVVQLATGLAALAAVEVGSLAQLGGSMVILALGVQLLKLALNGFDTAGFTLFTAAVASLAAIDPASLNQVGPALTALSVGVGLLRLAVTSEFVAQLVAFSTALTAVVASLAILSGLDLVAVTTAFSAMALSIPILAEAFTLLAPVLQAAALQFGLMVLTVGLLAVAFGLMAFALTAVALAFNLVNIGLTLFVLTMALAIQAMVLFGQAVVIAMTLALTTVVTSMALMTTAVTVGVGLMVVAMSTGMVAFVAVVLAGMTIALATIISFVPRFRAAGVLLGQNLAQGIQSQASAVAAAAKALGDAALNALKPFVAQFRAIGTQMGKAFVAGLRSQIGAARAAGAALGSAAASGLRSSASASPFPGLWTDMGQEMGGALAEGLLRTRSLVEASSSSLLAAAEVSARLDLAAINTPMIRSLGSLGRDDAAPVVSVSARVFVGDREITEIVRVEIDHHDDQLAALIEAR